MIFSSFSDSENLKNKSRKYSHEPHSLWWNNNKKINITFIIWCKHRSWISYSNKLYSRNPFDVGNIFIGFFKKLLISLRRSAFYVKIGFKFFMCFLWKSLFHNFENRKIGLFFNFSMRRSFMKSSWSLYSDNYFFIKII